MEKYTSCLLISSTEGWLKLTMQEDIFNKGIDAKKLPPGTKFIISTANTDYTLEKLDYGNNYRIHGGKYFPVPTNGVFSGCTWGGAAIRTDWIGYMMNMEFYKPDAKKNVNTSRIHNAKIVTPTWEYDMEWNTVV